ELSAALAFYTTFSIAPVLLIAVGIASFFLAPDTAENEIVSEIQKMVGPQGAHAIRQVIESSRGFGIGIRAVSVGIIAFIIGATAVFGELQAALNRIWDVKSKPDRGVIMPLMIDRLRSFSIALCVGFLLLVSLVISALISGLQQYMNNWLPGIPWFWQTANVIASFVVVAFFYRREISDRDLPRANCAGERIRRRRFSGSPVVLVLLLSADRLFWSGICSGLRSTVWIGNPAAEICRAHRSEERHNLASLSHLPGHAVWEIHPVMKMDLD